MVWSISRVVLKAEGVRRRVPVVRVPADSWARGAQWRPEPGRQRLAVHRLRADRERAALPLSRINMHAVKPLQPGRELRAQPGLMGKQPLRPLLAHETQSRGKAADAADVLRPGLGVVRQLLRHVGQARGAAAAALEQRVG